MQTPSRPDPVADPRFYQTYQILAPVQTHTRPATCREVDCEHWRNGWVTRIDTGTDLGARQANYIRMQSGRRFSTTHSIVSDSSLVTFTFPPGQECFTQHRVPLDRPATFLRLGGDWRGNPTGERLRHANAEDWRDDMGEHLQKIHEEHEKG